MIGKPIKAAIAVGIAVLCIPSVHAFSFSTSSKLTSSLPVRQFLSSKAKLHSVPHSSGRKQSLAEGIAQKYFSRNQAGSANASTVSTKPLSFRRSNVSKILLRTAFSLVSLCLLVSLSSAPAHARAAAARTATQAAAVEHLHTGQKIANYFRSFGLPDLTVLAIISALPVVELRGAVPVGVWMGYPIATVLPVCVLGNMLPIVPLLFLLRNPTLKRWLRPVLQRSERKTRELGMGSTAKQWASLAAFVGIPLPGTGAWTGAMGAFLLGMDSVVALTSIFTGVVAAGIIMSALTLAGTKGGIAALAMLFVFTGTQFFGDKKEAKQDFLETDPYYDQSNVPVNTYKNKSPFIGKVVSTKRIVGPRATGETCHIVIDHDGKFPYIEGQSWGVIPPGVRAKDGKPHAVRLYSIASSRYGDDLTGKTGSLCVRRATYWDPVLKADDPAKKGICSNFLCDTTAGSTVQLTGPSGKVMLLPGTAAAATTDLILVATGTGIAPYRGFLRRLFRERTPAAAAYKGQAWLFLGVANSDALLYDDEFQEYLSKHPQQFRLDYALSREQTNRAGGKMYIQDKVEEYADEIFDKLGQGAHIYFCGLKGMMPGIQNMLQSVAEAKGLNYEEWTKRLKTNKQWHVEVY